MKPFWKRPSKEKPKSKSKPSTTPLKLKSKPYSPPTRQKLESSPPKSIYKPQKAKAEFLKVFCELTHNRNPWAIWSDFVTMFACAISNSVDKSHFKEREELYLNTIKKYDKQEQSLFPELTANTIMALEDDPEQDFLGKLFMELGLSNKHNGQVFTPYGVCQLMAQITEGNIVNRIKQKGYLSIDDPCCGAGATLIAASNEAKRQLEKTEFNFQNHILIVGQDIDCISVMMCYIQISLLGMAGYFKIGNSITEPMISGDSMENYWVTPIYAIAPVWQYRRLFSKMDDLIRRGSNGSKEKR